MTPRPSSISDSLRELMTRKGWSRRVLAERVGVSVSTVDRWMRGVRPPRWHTAKLVPMGLELPPRQQPCVMRRVA